MTQPNMALDQVDGVEGPQRDVKDNGIQLGKKALNFLSSASDGTIASVLVAVCACVYILFGRVGLLVIGAIIGAVLHAVWERHESGSDEVLRRQKGRESGQEIARRLLDWQHIQNGAGSSPIQDTKTEITLAIAAGKALDFSAFPSEVASALDELVDSIIRDYVQYWYAPIIPQEAQFPLAARQTLTAFVLTLCNHQSRKRPADIFLTFLTNATSVFIVFLGELTGALMSGDGLELEVHEALNLYLDRSQDSNLANLVSLTEQDKRFLAISDDILQSFLDYKTYNCQPARSFLRQVLGKVVLQSVLRSISRPEWINSWIIHLLEEGEPELLNVIDAGVEKARDTSENLVLNAADSTREDLKAMVSSPSDTTTFSIHDKALPKVEDTMDVEGDKTESAPSEVAANLYNTKERPSGHISAMRQAVAGGRDQIAENIGKSASQLKTSDRSSLTEPIERFTSFDQIAPSYRPVPEATKQAPPLTLFNAKITLLDDDLPGERATIRNKPTSEYLLQIEPLSLVHSGWMVVRSFQEFEPLHEYLYKIANVSGAPGFSRKYQYLPAFKGKLKNVFRQDLQHYLSDALSFETLAESEGMKRFLDKDQGFKKLNGNSPAIKFAAPVGDAFQSVSKGMLGGLNTATKGVAAGSQAVFEGVGGLFAGQRKQVHQHKLSSTTPPRYSGSTARVSTDTEQSELIMPPSPQSSTSSKQQFINKDSTFPQPTHPAESNDIFIRGSEVVDQSVSEPALRNRHIVSRVGDIAIDSMQSSIDASIPKAVADDDQVALRSIQQDENSNQSNGVLRSSLVTETPLIPAKDYSETNSHLRDTLRSQDRQLALSEQETRVAIELMFAAINELYALSSVWNIRRTLLNAARNYLLRPGNPSLLSVQTLLQSMLDSALSSNSLAQNVRKIRENSLPTEQELASWPTAIGEEERENLRVKARQLLMSRGIPQALASIMGAAASEEALGKVFDALQIERVSQGLMSAIMLQGIRSIVQ